MSQPYNEEKVHAFRARLQDTPDVDLVDAGQLLRFDATTAQKLAEAAEGEIIRRAAAAEATLMLGSSGTSAKVESPLGPYVWAPVADVIAWAESKGVAWKAYFKPVAPPPPPEEWAPDTVKLKALAKGLGPAAVAEFEAFYTRKPGAPRVAYVLPSEDDDAAG